MLYIYFLNPKLGWCVGQSGAVLKTTNSGETWQNVSIASSRLFYEVVFVDEDNGWLCGTGDQFTEAQMAEFLGQNSSLRED